MLPIKEAAPTTSRAIRTIFDNLRAAALKHENQVLTRYTDQESAHLKGLLKQLIARTDGADTDEEGES